MHVTRAPLASGDPFILSDLITYMRLDPTDGAGLLEAQAMARSAALEVEAFAGVALLTTRVTVTLDGWPAEHALRLPIGPAVAPADPLAPAIELLAGGVSVAAERWQLGTRPKVWLEARDWRQGELTVSYLAGFAPAAEGVPPDLRQANCAQALAMFDGRGDADLRGLAPHAARIVARYRGVSL